MIDFLTYTPTDFTSNQDEEDDTSFFQSFTAHLTGYAGAPHDVYGLDPDSFLGLWVHDRIVEIELLHTLYSY